MTIKFLQMLAQFTKQTQFLLARYFSKQKYRLYKRWEPIYSLSHNMKGV